VNQGGQVRTAETATTKQPRLILGHDSTRERLWVAAAVTALLFAPRHGLAHGGIEAAGSPFALGGIPVREEQPDLRIGAQRQPLREQIPVREHRAGRPHVTARFRECAAQPASARVVLMPGAAHFVTVTIEACVIDGVS